MDFLYALFCFMLWLCVVALYHVLLRPLFRTKESATCFNTPTVEAKSAADKHTEIDTSHLSLADSASVNPFLDHLDRLPQDQGEYLPCYPLPEIESAPDLEVKTTAQIDEESAATEARLIESCGKLIEQLSGDFAVGAAGEDLLKPEEKQQAVEKDFDLSAYSINQN